MKSLKFIVAALCLTAVVTTGFSTSTAGAHGPCGDACFSAYSGAPGEVVEILGPEAELVVWNPPHNMMALGVPGQDKNCDNRCASRKPIYHLDQPTIIMHRAEKPSLVNFEVPETETGEYVIAIYDGSESGLHYTWDIFEVTAPSPVAEIDPTPHDDSPAPAKKNPVWPLPVGAFLAGGALGWALKRSRR